MEETLNLLLIPELMQYIPISLGEKQNLLFKAQPKAF
jgi:hypothetical protein